MKILSISNNRPFLEKIENKGVELNIQIKFSQPTDKDAIAATINENPNLDIALIELSNNLHGRGYIAAVRASYPELPVVVLSELENISLISTSSELGVKGFISYAYPPEITVLILTLVCAGGNYIHSIMKSDKEAIKRKVEIENRGISDTLTFTERQKDIIRLLLAGCSNKRIASHLNLSYGTVKNYVSTLMQALSVSSRFELVTKIQEQHSLPSNCSGYGYLGISLPESRFSKKREVNNIAATVGASANTSLPIESDAFRILPQRQLEVISKLATGCSNKEIANSLGIAVGTVKNYVSTLLEHFEVDSRLQLILAINQMEYERGGPQFRTVFSEDALLHNPSRKSKNLSVNNVGRHLHLMEDDDGGSQMV